MINKAEILAPAGSVEQLVAAVNNGCDSVYLGLHNFNARLKAPNFTLQNIGEWVDYCHLYNVKTYVAINTSIKNDEFASAIELLKKVYQLNVDGVILTDPALMRIASKLPKPFEIVASTQLNIHDAEGARFAKCCGATTIVCARECSLEQIRDIASTGITTECFVHGATCVCQSGQCLFSAMVGGNSGNRGLCAQPCRKKYSVNGSEPYYLLSARDLLGVDVAEELYNAGASVFKIEGRNRRAEYAGATSRVYRQLFDNNFRQNEMNRSLLAEVYNRDMSRLSYLDSDNANIVSPLCQNHAGVAVGTVCGNSVKTDVFINKGDGFKIFSNGREICGGIAIDSGSGLVRTDFGKQARDGMEVRRTSSVKASRDITSKRRLLPVEIDFYAQPNKPTLIKAKCNGTEVQLRGSEPSLAQNCPLLPHEAEQQLKKCGNSVFEIVAVTLDVGNVFLAKSQINSLRREILERLRGELVRNYNSRFDARRQMNLNEILAPKKACQIDCVPTVAVRCYNIEDLAQASKFATVIYKPESLDKNAFAMAQKAGAFLDLPPFAEIEYLREELSECRTKLVCNNVGQVQLARELDLSYIAGVGLNIYNDQIASIFGDAVTFIYSLELTVKEISQFCNKSGLIFVDGAVPLMHLVHCPYKLKEQLQGRVLQCSQCKNTEPLLYRDALGNEFVVRKRKAKRCTFELINGKKLSAIAHLKLPNRYMVDFDDDVVKHYVALNNGIDDDYAETDPYTKGRLFLKVK